MSDLDYPDIDQLIHLIEDDNEPLTVEPSSYPFNYKDL